MGGRQPSFLTSSGGGDRVLWGIIGTNAVIFGAWMISDSNRRLQAFLIRNFTLSGLRVQHFHEYHTLITSTFSHKTLSHFALNMFTLYSLGSSVAYAIGAQRFTILYLGGGLVSSLCQAYWPQIVPRSWPAWKYTSLNEISLGASGAVNAVVAWSILANPTSTLLIYGIVPVPAALFGLAFIGMDAYSLYQGNSGIGNAAHLGGAVFGASMFLLTRGRWRGRF